MTGIHEKKSPIAHRNDETIVAIITPPGEGGIAAIRIAGRRSLALLQKHFRPVSQERKRPVPFVMRYGYFVNGQGDTIDEVMAVYMPKGKSYTGLEQVEIFCHGGRQVATNILNEIISSGARVAEPGEFTKLAFLSGRIDLARAEAVAEIIGANTDSSFHAAKEHLLGAYAEHIHMLREEIINIIAEVEASIDFPEEEIDPADTRRLIHMVDAIIRQIEDLVQTYTGGRIIKEGYKIAISGRPNAGKSSLFNLLLRQQRALVTPTAGTTRDYLSEWIDLDGFAVNLIDTAGLRKGGGAIEKAGRVSAMKIISDADLLIWIIDLAEKGWATKLRADLEFVKKHIKLLVGNKIDLLENYRTVIKRGGIFDLTPISCLTGKGINELKKKIVDRINETMPDLTSGLIVTSARHQQKLQAALKNLRRAKTKMKLGESPEITAFDLRQAANAIDEITGKVYTEDILDRIFSKFCIGK